MVQTPTPRDFGECQRWKFMGECLCFDEFADVALMAKTWNSQKPDPFHGFLAPGSENFGLPLNKKK